MSHTWSCLYTICQKALTQFLKVNNKIALGFKISSLQEGLFFKLDDSIRISHTSSNLWITWLCVLCSCSQINKFAFQPKPWTLCWEIIPHGSTILDLCEIITFVYLAGSSPDINGLGVWDWWKLSWYATGLRWHCQQCCDPQRHSGRYSVLVKPETDPRYYDKHTAGHIDCDQVVGEFSLEDQLYFQTTVLACNSKSV